MTEPRNTINVPVAGSNRFEQDVVMAISRLKASVMSPDGSPSFANLLLTDLDASKLAGTDADKSFQSINVGDSIALTGTTLDTIQDIRATAAPTFAGLALTGLSGVLQATAGVVSGSATLDDVPDGASYERVAANQLSSGIYIDATTAVKGIASFDSGSFSVTNGAVSLVAGGGLNHNDFGGLQGGTAAEYYHLTATEHGYVSGANAQSVLTTASPTFAGLTVGTSTNYAAFAADGELTLNGTARVTKEVNVAIRDFAPGASGPADKIYGDYHVKEFTIGDDAIVNFELPHDWAAGTDLNVYVVWMIDEAYATGSGEVQWQITWSACPICPISATLYEAEDAVLNVVVVFSAIGGYTGTGFVDYVAARGEYIEWTVNVGDAGLYDLQFRYALASGDRPLAISVNGVLVVPSLSFPATGSYSAWGTVSTVQTLSAGSNTIRATSIGFSGANVDHLAVTPVTVIDAPTHTGTLDFGDQNIPATAKYLTRSAAGTISGASLSAEDLLGFTVSRVALDDGSDPTAEPGIAHLQIHYTADKLGIAT
jgi:hypothetical protein